MPEKRIEVKAFRVTLHCEKCGGLMGSTGQAYMTYPVQYPYECSSCGHKEVSRHRYPRTVYEPTEPVQGCDKCSYWSIPENRCKIGDPRDDSECGEFLEEEKCP